MPRSGGGASLSSARWRPAAARGRRPPAWRWPTTGASLLEVLRDRPRRPSAQGRLQPPGPVRLLHGAGRRRAPGRLRDPGPAGRRPPGDHPRRARPTADAAALGRGASAPRAAASAGSARPGIVVRLAALRGQGHGGGRPRRRRAGARRPPVPLHRLAHDPRGLGRRPRSPRACRRPADRGPRRRRPAGHARGRRAPGRGARTSPSAGAASPTTRAPADALVGRARRRRRLGRRARRWPRPGRAAGKVQGRRTTVAPRHPLEVPAGDWAVTLRTDLGGARLPGDRRLLVRARRRAGVAARQRRRLRGQGRPRRPPPPPGAWPTEHGRAGAGAAVAGGRGPRSAPSGRRVAAGVRADGTGVAAGGPHAGRRRALVADVAPGPRRGGGRRGRPAHLAAPCGPPGGPRRPSCSPPLRAGGRRRAVAAPGGGERHAEVEPAAPSRVRVRCGDPLDEVVLRSYCVGAAHMALGWVTLRGHRRRRRRAAPSTSRSARSASCGPPTRRRSRWRSSRRRRPAGARRPTPCSPPWRPPPGSARASPRSGRPAGGCADRPPTALRGRRPPPLTVAAVTSASVAEPAAGRCRSIPGGHPRRSAATGPLPGTSRCCSAGKR